MAGSEEARSFADLTAHLLDSAAAGQQARIGMHGDLNAQREAIPYKAALGAEDSFLRGRDLRRREEMQNLQMSAQDIANQRAQGSLSEEAARRDAMDTSADGGPTVRQRQLAAETGQMESEASRSKTIAQYQEANEKQAARAALDAHNLTNSQLAAQHFTLGSAQADREQQLLRLQIAGINGDLNMPSEEKAQQQEKLTQAFMAHNPTVDPNVVRGIVNTERNNTSRATQEYLRTQEFLTTQSPEYSSLQKVLEPVTPQIQALHALDNNFKAYSNYAALPAGQLGQLESAQSTAALNSFADEVGKIDPNLAVAAKSTVGLDLKTTAQKLADIRDEAYKKVQGDWNGAKSTLTGAMQQRREAQAVDQALNRVSGGSPAAGKPNPFAPQTAVSGAQQQPKFLTPIPGGQGPGTAQGGNFAQPQQGAMQPVQAPVNAPPPPPTMNWSPYRQGGQ